MEVYRSYIRGLFARLMIKKKFLQIRIPSKENASESGLEYEDYRQRMEAAYDIDYNKISQECSKKIQEFSSHHKAIIKTPDNCQLIMQLKDRKWIADAGDGDLPCGEVYIAPLEEETEGSICFEKLYVEELGLLGKVKLDIKHGKVVFSDNSKFNEFLSSVPDGGNLICELGIGMNESVKDLCGFVLLDEKIAGTFHTALGNNILFGGKNDTPFHTDLVGFGNIEMV